MGKKIYTEDTGRCFVRCLGRLLGIDESTIPNFSHRYRDEDWLIECQKWTRESCKVEVVCWKWCDSARELTKHLTIIAGGDVADKNYDCGHAVIYKHNKFLWDPSGVGDLDDGVSEVYVLVPHNISDMIHSKGANHG